MFPAQKLKRLLDIIPHNQIYYPPIKDLIIHHSDRPFCYEHIIQEPSICIVINGEREITLGGQSYLFGNSHFMFCPVDVPMCGKIIRATASEPFVVLSMKLDLQIIRKLLSEYDFHFSAHQNNSASFEQWDLDDGLANAFERLLFLLESPKDIGFIAPLIQQEIYYRLLTGRQGVKLKEMADFGSNTRKIAKAAEYLRVHFRETVRTDTLATLCGMSLSGFHSHFRKTTTLSPLQYQKSLRLIEAKRLIVDEDYPVSAAAYEVGYESPSQFSRDYKRFFGNPPSLSEK